MTGRARRDVERLRHGVITGQWILGLVVDPDTAIDDVTVTRDELTIGMPSAVDAARLAHRLHLARPNRLAILPRAIWEWSGVWADADIVLVGNGRPLTNGVSGRLCDGCGTPLGDVTPDEVDAAYAGLPLPTVVTDCPVCVTEHGPTGVQVVEAAS